MPFNAGFDTRCVRNASGSGKPQAGGKPKSSGDFTRPGERLQFAIEHGHLYYIYPWKIVIFNYVGLPEGKWGFPKENPYWKVEENGDLSHQIGDWMGFIAASFSSWVDAHTLVFELNGGYD